MQTGPEGRLQRSAIVGGHRAGLHQRIDEQAQTEVGGLATGRDVRVIQKSQTLEVVHGAADGRWRHLVVHRARDAHRSHGLSGSEVGFDHAPEHLARAGVEVGQKRC